MEKKVRPLVMIHGLWNNPRIFNRLSSKLIRRFDVPLFVPHLKHDFGRKNLNDLAANLDVYIASTLSQYKYLDILGFSMGGLIGRIWIQSLGGFERTKRFITVGTPHKGTFTAQLIPNCLLAGIADMKRNSLLVRQLNNDTSKLENIECKSFYCKSDLMVFPGWDAIMPFGSNYDLPVLTHRQLIQDPNAVNLLLKEIIDF